MISRRTVLTGTALTALGALPAAAASPAAPPPARRRRQARPNLLVLVTDDQPMDTGWGLPRLHRHMAEQGVTFTFAHTTTPLCAPARSSIMTGRRAHHHGVRDNRHPRRLDATRTLQHRLRETGYRTGMVGKYLNGWRAEDAPPFFEHYAMMARPRYEDALWSVNGGRYKRSQYTTSVVRDEALSFLGEPDPRPWFLYVAPYAPHAPYHPEPKYADLEVPPWTPGPDAAEPDRSDKPPYIRDSEATVTDGRELRAKQLRALRSVDDLFAALVAGLRASGQLENTVIAVISDNGYSWSQHGWLRKSVPYAPAVRVPLWLAWPRGGLGGGRADGRMAANIDLAPTLLEAAGAEPLPCDGRSLLSTWDRPELVIEWWNGREKIAHQPPTWTSLLSRDRQYTEYLDTYLDAEGRPTEGTGAVVFREYYDLRSDPDQLRNLLPEGADPARLGAQLRRLRSGA
ncbi:sulfatase [Actinocorallia longicatena]|uniref:Sulfatase N-terminal domain-containing protein n=1 Tax=Actinocorallia longicatena TaxID=111803 RepID=A0ABP6QD93_9ACTN